MRTKQHIFLTALMMMHAGFVGAMEAQSFINTPTLDGKDNTPLHLATLNTDTAMVKFLLKQNADANIRNAEGMTSLECALDIAKKRDFTESMNMNMINLLVLYTKNRSCLNKKQNEAGETILHFLARLPQRDETITELLKHGAKQLVSNNGLYPIHEATKAGLKRNVHALFNETTMISNDEDGYVRRFCTITIHKEVDDVAVLLVEPAAGESDSQIDGDAITGEEKMSALFQAHRLEYYRNNPY